MLSFKRLAGVSQMSFENVIEVRNLSKCFNMYESPSDRLKQMLFRKNKYYKEFWALNNVSFNIRRGETVGIVGKNGSGKSTLLQIICGTLNQTSGEVITRGRIAALLELGSGFNPEFTGRENVYMNAVLLGLKRSEIDNKFNSIVEFADIGEFIDQPVKTYSSGMMVRLAFAVQAQIEPDILIVDEALAVGDAKFQARCFERLNQLKENGTSILLVTHSTEQIVCHCSRAILIDAGNVINIDDPRVITNQYLDLLFGRTAKRSNPVSQESILTENYKESVHETELSYSLDTYILRPSYNELSYRWGDARAVILDFILATEAEDYPSSVISGSAVVIKTSVRFNENITRPILGCTIKTKDGITVYGTNTEILEIFDHEYICHADSVAIFEIKFLANLAPGDYFISLGIASHFNGEVVPHDRRYDSILLTISPDKKMFGLANLSMEILKNE